MTIRSRRIAMLACAALAGCAQKPPKDGLDFEHGVYVRHGKRYATPEAAGLVCTPPPCVVIPGKGLYVHAGQTIEPPSESKP